MGNVVAIVGRPNVGKSTLYNRLVGKREAIIDDISGVTRDRMYGVANWNGKNFVVVDTGGFVRDSSDVFEAAIRTQVRIAVDEASVIVFVTDAATGITDLDEQVADMLRRSKKRVLLAVNKVDNSARQLEASEFWSLGFEDTFFIASISGSGTGELLDAITDSIDEYQPTDIGIPKFAIVGQPNVGKSSLVNALLGEDRNIVTDIAGTTRDAIHTRYTKFEKDFLLIDTAGIRKKRNVHEDLEFYSVMRAINAIEEADVCILMVDAQTGMETQDVSIFRLAQRRNKGMVILVNKWDLLPKETNTARDFEAELHKRIAPFTDVPIIFTSVLEKQRIFKAIEAAIQVYENRTRRISTSSFNDWLKETTDAYQPPSHRGHFIKIKYGTQLPTYYPAFALFCNYPNHVKDAYKQYLENKLRERFEFSGVPIGIYFREK